MHDPNAASILEAAQRSGSRSPDVGERTRTWERVGVGVLATIVCTAFWTAVLDDRAVPTARPAVQEVRRPEPRPPADEHCSTGAATALDVVAPAAPAPAPRSAKLQRSRTPRPMTKRTPPAPPRRRPLLQPNPY